jgi:hypothetical protein
MIKVMTTYELPRIKNQVLSIYFESAKDIINDVSKDVKIDPINYVGFSLSFMEAKVISAEGALSLIRSVAFDYESIKNRIENAMTVEKFFQEIFSISSQYEFMPTGEYIMQRIFQIEIDDMPA